MRTIGRAYFDKPKKRWDVTVEPHAMLEFKRVFPKVHTGELGTVHLSDSPETARRLKWFASMWPLDFTPAEYVEARATEYEAQQTAVERILAADYVARKFDVARPLRPYQEPAVELALAGLGMPDRGLLIADELGLGKTTEAIATFCDPRALPAVYVTLTALPPQVEREIHKVLPGLRTHVVKSGTPYDLTKKPYSRTGQRIPLPDVIIISWSKLHGWAETLAKLGIGVIVFDEAHELRHPDTDRYRAAQHIRASARMCVGMTGTPVFGMGSQIHRVMDVIAPGALGDWDEFRREQCGGDGGEKPALKDPDALGFHLRNVGLFLRRTRKEVGIALPPLQRITVPVESDGPALHDVAGRAIELARKILEVGGKGEEKMRAGGELDWKLRQATGIGKARHVAEFVKMQLEAGEKVLLYGWHHVVYDIWREQLAEYKPAIYTGEQTSNTQRQEAIDRFVGRHQNGRPHADPTRLLIMSLRSGAGLDGLQYAGCNVVVFGELDWAAAVHQQGEARVDRPGHPGATLAYYCVSDTGSDPIIMDMLGLKEAQLVGLRDPGTGKAVKVPDQDAIKLRMKRMAADYLNRHDPRALDRIPGARDLLVANDPPAAPQAQEQATPAPRPPTVPPIVTPEATGRPLVVDVPPIVAPDLPGIGLAAVREHYTDLTSRFAAPQAFVKVERVVTPEVAALVIDDPVATLGRERLDANANVYPSQYTAPGAARAGALPAPRRLGNALPPGLAAQAVAIDAAARARAALEASKTPPPPPRLVLPPPRRLGNPIVPVR